MCQRGKREEGGGKLKEEGGKGASEGGERKGSRTETRNNTDQGPREPMESKKSYWKAAEREQRREREAGGSEGEAGPGSIPHPGPSHQNSCH